MHLVSYMRRSGKILILNKEGIIEKISYERRAYESVDEKSLSILNYIPKKRRKKEFMHLRVNLPSSSVKKKKNSVN